MKLVFTLFFILFSNVATASCFKLAGEEFHLDWKILYSIASIESSLNADAINVNKNNSVDVGIMQINSIHQHELSTLGIKMDELFEPCKNIIVGAWLLKRSIMSANGDVWKGVGRYHSATPELQKKYIKKVKHVYFDISSNNTDGE